MQKNKLIAAAACAVLLFTACGNTIGTVSEREVLTETAAVTTTTQQTTVTSAAPAVSEETTTTTAQTATVSESESSTASEPAVIIPEKKDDSSAAEVTEGNKEAAEGDTGDKSDNSDSSDNGETGNNSDNGEKKEKKPNSGEIKEPYSNAYALYCVDDKEFIAGKALDKQISLASTTKLLTASLALRYLDPGAVITVGDEVYYAKPNSTMSYLLPWTEITVYDLLAAMLLPSGNDAAYVVAVNTARAAAGDPYMTIDEAVDYFCGLMNGFAAELGMEDSHFANPEGWDDSEHYTTVNDMVKLAEYVLTVPELCEITSDHIWYFDSPVSGNLIWNNTNLFLDPYSAYYRTDCIGIKTGTTADAGCCLVSAFDENGKTYLCIVMGCNESEDRYVLVNKILKKYLKA